MSSSLCLALSGLVPLPVEDDLQGKWPQAPINLNSAAGGMLKLTPVTCIKELIQNFIDGCKTMIVKLKADGYTVDLHQFPKANSTIWVYRVDRKLLGFIYRLNAEVYAVNYGYVLGPSILTCNFSSKAKSGDVMIGRRTEGYVGKHGDGLKSGSNAFLSHLFQSQPQHANSSLYYVLGKVKVNLELRPMEAYERKNDNDDITELRHQRLWAATSAASAEDLPFKLPFSDEFSAVAMKCVPADAIRLEELFLDLSGDHGRVIECRRMLDATFLHPLEGFTVLLDKKFDGCFFLRGVLVSRIPGIGFGLNIHQNMNIGRDRDDFSMKRAHVEDFFLNLQYAGQWKTDIMDFLLYMMLKPQSRGESVTDKDVAPITKQWVARFGTAITVQEPNLVKQCLEHRRPRSNIVTSLLQRYKSVMGVREQDMIISVQSSQKLASVSKALSAMDCKVFRVSDAFFQSLHTYSLIENFDKTVLQAFQSNLVKRYSKEEGHVMNLLRARLSDLYPDENYKDRIHLVRVDLSTIEECHNPEDGCKHWFVGHNMVTKGFAHEKHPCRATGDGCNCVVNSLSLGILKDTQSLLHLINMIDKPLELVENVNLDLDTDVQECSTISTYPVVCTPDIGFMLRGEAVASGDLILTLADLSQGCGEDDFSFDFDYEVAGMKDQFVIHRKTTYFRLLLPGIPSAINLSDPELQSSIFQDMDDNYYLKADNQDHLPRKLQYTVSVPRSYFADVRCDDKLKVQTKDKSLLPASKFSAVQHLIQYCRDFRVVANAIEFMEDKPSSQTPMEYLWRNQVGYCRHRASMFHYFAGRCRLTSRLIHNSIHCFVELKVDGCWKRLDLGGGGGGAAPSRQGVVAFSQKSSTANKLWVKPTPELGIKKPAVVSEGTKPVQLSTDARVGKKRKASCAPDCGGHHVTCEEYAQMSRDVIMVE